MSLLAEGEVVGSFLPATFLFLAGLATASPHALVLDEATPQWREGPVRYLLKVREDEAFKKLKSTPERDAFIKKFWAALDPTPETPFNEKRVEFWTRVNIADRLFGEGVEPGWKSDRGKIYILLGPPEERNRYARREIWTYRGLPMLGAPPELRLAFYQGVSGQYKLSPMALPDHAPLAGDRYLGPEDPFSLQFELASAQIIPGRILMPEGIVSTDFFFPALHPNEQFRSFRAVDGSTFLTMDLSLEEGQFRPQLPAGSSPQLTLSASFFSGEQSEPVMRFTRPLTLERDEAATRNQLLQFQTDFDLPPGRYRGDFILVESRSHLGSYFSRTLTVPDYRQGLPLSSITVSLLEEAGSAPQAPRKDPPWLSPTTDSFSPGQTLLFTYQVYNAQYKEEHADLDVEYRLFLAQGQVMRAVGRPVEIHHVQGETLSYSLPLTSYPMGDYRIQVMVTDLNSGVATFREAEFQVVAASGLEPKASSGTHP